ncbi:MAG TPA: pitrilysin family protein [Tepidisphaeraceae bacterium]|jgi:zinc protease|nr:pitrilysin family protein [Tepidisphaeraceae bacterium]
MRRTVCVLLLIVGFIGRLAVAAEGPASIEFQTETLDNGLRVIYAPLKTAPVVHVRVLYHVGSRDERPDRQGFAHMFEHMMFRGSAHVKPEEHMQLVGGVGGTSNAYTSFDQTVYYQTLPSSHLNTALYLEADRMASFKVSEEIYQTERKVVAEEWRMRQNRPYGTVYEDLLKNVFTTHSYRWTPIGNMDHLRAAPVNELQEFFNTYYVPNNAILVISGDFEVPAAKEMVQKYFAWIPRGPEVKRAIPEEPEQDAARRVISPQRVPLPQVTRAFRLPPYTHPDTDAISLLASILGSGSSSRLDRKLVNSEQPVAVDSYASPLTLQDGGILGIGATVLQGADPAAVETAIEEVLAEVRENGVTKEELEKAKTQVRVAVVRGRETSEDIASQLGGEALLAGDPSRVNTELDRLEKITVADVNRVAKEYLKPSASTTLVVQPDPTGAAARTAATQVAAIAEAPVVAATAPVAARVVEFPADYPTAPPLADLPMGKAFEKGTEIDVNGVRVIVMPDHRLSLVNWGLTMRQGGHSVPDDQLGVGGLTAQLLQRGTKDQTFDEFAKDLESRGISLSADDWGDVTVINGSSTTDQFEHGLSQTRAMLTQPRLDADEFAKLKAQTLSGLQVEMESPSGVASRDLMQAIYGPTPLGRSASPATVSGIELDDVKQYWQQAYRPDDAILVFSGDVTVESARAQAEKLLEGWAPGKPVNDRDVDYTPKPPASPRILLVDRPEGKQATVRMGTLAYDIHTDDKFAGAVANRILSGGIDGRMMKYVRAEKGLVYTAVGIFQPKRNGGEFIANADTAVETTAEAIEAMNTVIERMRKENVTDAELKDAKTRVAGSMLMQLDTIKQQAQFRVDGILNGYPIDYYDNYPKRIAEVTADAVREVMTKYADPKDLKIVVVAPAAATEGQLKELGEVEVRPMPAQRGQPATQPAPSPEMLKPAA